MLSHPITGSPMLRQKPRLDLSIQLITWEVTCRLKPPNFNISNAWFENQYGNHVMGKDRSWIVHYGHISPLLSTEMTLTSWKVLLLGLSNSCTDLPILDRGGPQLTQCSLWNFKHSVSHAGTSRSSQRACVTVSACLFLFSHDDLGEGKWS